MNSSKPNIPKNLIRGLIDVLHKPKAGCVFKLLIGFGDEPIFSPDTGIIRAPLPFKPIRIKCYRSDGPSDCNLNVLSEIFKHYGIDYKLRVYIKYKTIVITITSTDFKKIEPNKFLNINGAMLEWFPRDYEHDYVVSLGINEMFADRLITNPTKLAQNLKKSCDKRFLLTFQTAI